MLNLNLRTGVIPGALKTPQELLLDKTRDERFFNERFGNLTAGSSVNGLDEVLFIFLKDLFNPDAHAEDLRASAADLFDQIFERSSDPSQAFFTIGEAVERLNIGGYKELKAAMLALCDEAIGNPSGPSLDEAFQGSNLTAYKGLAPDLKGKITSALFARDSSAEAILFGSFLSVENYDELDGIFEIVREAEGIRGISKKLEAREASVLELRTLSTKLHEFREASKRANAAQAAFVKAASNPALKLKIGEKVALGIKLEDRNKAIVDADRLSCLIAREYNALAKSLGIKFSELLRWIQEAPEDQGLIAYIDSLPDRVRTVDGESLVDAEAKQLNRFVDLSRKEGLIAEAQANLSTILRPAFDALGIELPNDLLGTSFNLAPVVEALDECTGNEGRDSLATSFNFPSFSNPSMNGATAAVAASQAKGAAIAAMNLAQEAEGPEAPDLSRAEKLKLMRGDIGFEPSYGQLILREAYLLEEDIGVLSGLLKQGAFHKFQSMGELTRKQISSVLTEDGKPSVTAEEIRTGETNKEISKLLADTEYIKHAGYKDLPLVAFARSTEMEPEDLDAYVGQIEELIEMARFFFASLVSELGKNDDNDELLEVLSSTRRFRELLHSLTEDEANGGVDYQRLFLLSHLENFRNGAQPKIASELSELKFHLYAAGEDGVRLLKRVDGIENLLGKISSIQKREASLGEFSVEEENIDKWVERSAGGDAETKRLITLALDYDAQAQLGISFEEAQKLGLLDQNPDLEDIEKGRDLYIAAKRERRDFRGEVYKSYESHLMALMSALWELETDLSENLDDVPDFFKDREASLLVTMAAALPAKVLSYEGIISSTNCKDMSDRLELAQSLMEGALQAL